MTRFAKNWVKWPSYSVDARNVDFELHAMSPCQQQAKRHTRYDDGAAPPCVEEQSQHF